MQKNQLINGPFKSAHQKIGKLKGKDKEKAITELNERMEMYEVAKDFADFYPKIYTSDVLLAIVNAKTNVEASNLLTTLRKKQGELL